jgi:putative redox protein
MLLKTVTRFISDYEYESSNESGNVVKIDMYPREKKKHQSPMELVLSAIAGCAAVDVVQMLKKKRKTVVDLIIETEGNRRNEIPKAFTDITLKFILTSPDTTDVDFYKVVKLAVDKYCSVSESLKGKVNIKYLAEVNPVIQEQL